MSSPESTVSSPSSVRVVLGCNNFGVTSPPNCLFTSLYSPSTGFTNLKRHSSSYGSPGWLTLGPDGVLLAADESVPGRLLVLDANDADLPLKDVKATGGHPCHAAYAEKHGCAVTCDYTGGTVTVVPLSVPGPTITLDHSVLYEKAGTGRADRQESAHPHQSVVVGDFLLVVDLGCSCVASYHLPSVLGGETTSPAHVYQAERDYGCRHLAVVGGEDVYVVNELVSSLSHLKLEGNGRLSSVLKTIRLDATAPEETRDHHRGGGGIVSHGGKLYVTLRHTVEGKVAVVSLGAGGEPAVERVVGAGGECPRFVGVVGGNVVVCCQEAKRVVEVDVDRPPLEVGERVTAVIPLP